MSEWKDCTSYRPGEERVPRSWSAQCGPLRIVITKGHIAHPGKWVMSAYGLAIDCMEVGPDSMNVEDAQFAAKNMVVHHLKKLTAAVSKLA